MLNNIAVYPGSFDPCTNGHLDIITRACRLYDKVYVAVLINSSKTPTFCAQERVDMLHRVTYNISNVEVISFDGLLVKFAEQMNAGVIIKGLRAMSDFEYEFQMSLANKELAADIETLFMTTSIDNLFLSSSMIKEVAKNGGDISHFVPKEIREQISAKFKG